MTSRPPRSLITPTSNPLLEHALRDKLQRRSETTGSLGELEPLALRIGLIQNTLKPSFREPQAVLFASDHGLAVEGLPTAPGHSTANRARQALTGQLPVSVFAAIQVSAVRASGPRHSAVHAESWPTTTVTFATSTAPFAGAAVH